MKTPDFIITSNTLQFGGAERQRVALANALCSRGFAAQLRLMQGYGPLAEELTDRVEVVQESWHRSARRERPGTLLVSGSTNTEIAFALMWRARNAPHGRWVVAHHHPAADARGVFSRALAAAIRRADGAIYLSETHRHDHLVHQRLDRGRYWFAPNGVALPTATQLRRSPAPGEPVTMVFAGRLVRSKRVDLLVRALAAGMEDLAWTLDIYGDGPAREEVEALIPARLSQRIRVRGWCHDVPAMLREADLFVFPSRFEAQPMVILEAMAAGVPVVSAAVASVPEMLADGAGLVIEGDDEHSWRSSLRALIQDASRRHQLAEQGQRRARDHYSVPAMANRYVEIRAELVGERR